MRHDSNKREFGTWEKKMGGKCKIKYRIIENKASVLVMWSLAIYTINQILQWQSTHYDLFYIMSQHGCHEVQDVFLWPRIMGCRYDLRWGKNFRQVYWVSVNPRSWGICSDNRVPKDHLIGLEVSVYDYWSWGRGLDSRHFLNFKCGLGLERGPPSLVRTIG